jgi:hypothetical protein
VQQKCSEYKIPANEETIQLDQASSVVPLHHNNIVPLYHTFF